MYISSTFLRTIQIFFSNLQYNVFPYLKSDRTNWLLVALIWWFAIQKHVHEKTFDILLGWRTDFLSLQPTICFQGCHVNHLFTYVTE